MKVNFMCVGAQKSGTTTLYNVLRQHEEIYLPTAKEIYYFSDDKLFKKGADWYHKYCKGYKGQAVIGEITPGYLCCPETAERIYKYNPEMKLVIMLRNPVHRAFSHYLMKKRNGREKEVFSSCIHKELNELENGLVDQNVKNYVSRGFYAKQIIRYLEFFDISSIHFVIFENFIRDQENHIRDILKFLDLSEQSGLNYDICSNSFYVPRFSILQKCYCNIPINIRTKFIRNMPDAIKEICKKITRKKGNKEKMDPSTAIAIYNYVKNDISDLETLLDTKLDIWRIKGKDT